MKLAFVCAVLLSLTSLGKYSVYLRALLFNKNKKKSSYNQIIRIYKLNLFCGMSVVLLTHSNDYDYIHTLGQSDKI